MSLNQEFIDLYNSLVKPTLMSNYILVSEKLLTSGIEREIREAVKSTFNKYLSSSGEQYVAVGRQNDSDSSISYSDDEYIIFEFITLCLISGYYHLSNIDIDVDSLSSFGFQKCEYFILTLLKSINSGLTTDDNIKNTAFNSILSVIREDVDYHTYISSELYIEDIKHIKKCLEPTTEKAFLDEEDEKMILGHMSGKLKNLLSSLRKVYSELLADAYGLEKYKGVFVFNNIYGVQGLDLSYGLKTISPNGSLTEYFAPPLADAYPFYKPMEGVPDDSNYGFKKYSDRQFDYNIMYKGFLKGDNKPVYFPHKMLEILNATQFTTNIHTQVYKPTNSGRNLISYLNYLCGSPNALYTKSDYDKLPPMGRVFLNTFCCGISSKLTEYNNINNANLTIEEVFGERDIHGVRSEFVAYAESFANYCFRCFTTCFVLMSIENKDDLIYDFRIRACYPDNIELDNSSYIAKVGGSGKYSSASLLPDKAEFINKNIVNTDIGETYIQDYTYCANPDLAYGRPLFAYKAMQKMGEQGRLINWDSILLGKSEAGGLITSASSKRDASAKINIQDVHMHYLIAGSRSGKGVTGYNILGTALTSGLPVFYMDRKPDTASIMKSISPNMFAINGGDYQSVYDVSQSFKRENLPFKIPPYLKSFFGNDYKLMCDYAYLRGVLFALNLAVFMDKSKCQGNPLYEKLNSRLKGGYFIVLDEFTNFTNDFLQKYIVPFSDDGDAVFNKLPKVATYKEAVSKGFASMKSSNVKLEKLKSKMQDALENGKKGSVSEGDLQLEKEKFDDAMDELATETIDLSKLYWNAFYKKYNTIFEGWTSLKKAGAGVMLNTHLFIIGQDLEPILFDSDSLDTSNGTMMFNKSPINSKVVQKKGVASNLFYKFLNDNPADIILGYQPPDKGKPTYLAQGESWSKTVNSKANNLLTAEKRFFCYGKMLDSNKADFMYKIAETDKAFNGSPEKIREFVNGFEYFKPFLILNTGDVPSEEYLYPDPNDHSVTYVSSELELDRKERTGSAQYVAQCITSCNNVGITYDDLVADNPDPNNPSTLNPLIGFEAYMNALLTSNKSDKSLMDLLGASGEIANIIVQEVLGYNGTWEDYIYDFSAETLFDWEDWIKALEGKDSVQERLKDSFFLPFFVNKSAGGETFASIFKDQLGSLYQYYGDTSGGTEIAQSIQREVHSYEEGGYTDDSVPQSVSSVNSYDSPRASSNTTESTAYDFYNQPDEPKQQEDNFVFTKEMANEIVNKTINNYDSLHPDKPIRRFIMDYEISEMADFLVSIMNS